MCLITMPGAETIVLKKDNIVWKFVDVDEHTGKAYPLLFGRGVFGYCPGVTMYQPIRKYDSGADSCPRYADVFEYKYFNNKLDAVVLAMGMINAVSRGLIDAWIEGFHFYETRKRSKESSYYGRYTLCRFVVPKGASIVLSGNGVGIASAITYSPLPEKERSKPCV
jgi:hypothetical protein